MTTIRTSHAVEKQVAKQLPLPAAPAQQAAPATSAWVRFWFTPVDAIGLHGLRVFAGLLFLAWLLPFAGQIDGLFGLQGYFDLQAYSEASRLPDGSPRPLGWSILYLTAKDSTTLAITYWASIGVLILFTLGLWTRLTAILTFLIVASFTANPAHATDVDPLLALLAFYLMLGYVFLGQRTAGQPLLSRILGSNELLVFRPRYPNTDDPAYSLAANVALRLLQVHLAIVIVTSGLHKLQFGDWWAGVAFWYALYPPFQATLADARTHVESGEAFLFLLSVSAYVTLAWQIGFPLFAWRPKARFVLIGGALVGWLGTAFLFQTPLYGPALLVGCLAFLSPAFWQRWVIRLTRIPGFERLAQRQSASAGEEADLVTRIDAASSLVTTGRV
jgi:hypothetical protein